MPPAGHPTGKVSAACGPGWASAAFQPRDGLRSRRSCAPATHRIPVLSSRGAAITGQATVVTPQLGGPARGHGLDYRHWGGNLVDGCTTYYGDAWLALAGALADGTLASCAEGG